MFPRLPTRLPRMIAPVALLALPLFASAGRAAVPDPTKCLVQNVIVGSWSGNPVPTSVQPCGPKHPGLFLVSVRDALNNPIGGATVKIFLAGSGVRIYTAQDAGIVVICPGQEVGTTADATGLAYFSLRLAGYVEGPSVTVTANGVTLATVPAISPDYDGDGRVSLADFAIFATDYLDPFAVRLRSDFDNCPSNRLSDFAYFAAEYSASNPLPPSPVCP